MSSPTAVIAEDEPLLRAELREKLNKLWSELIICAEASDGLEALLAPQQHSPRVLSLDIQMQGLSGLEVAHQASGKSNIVFISAYDHHAIEAFERGGMMPRSRPLSEP